MWPMLLGVGPLLGNGRLIGFTTRSGFAGYVSYHDGILTAGRDRVTAPLTVPMLDPAPPVAVLTGSSTVSAGEAVAVYTAPILPDQITIPPDSSTTEATARTWLQLLRRRGQPMSARQASGRL